MSADRIDPEAIEAGVLALVESYGTGRSELDDTAVEAAIRAAERARGGEMEHGRHGSVCGIERDGSCGMSCRCQCHFDRGREVLADV